MHCLCTCIPSPWGGSVGKAFGVSTKMLCDFNTKPVNKDVLEYTHRWASCRLVIHPGPQLYGMTAVL